MNTYPIRHSCGFTLLPWNVVVHYVPKGKKRPVQRTFVRYAESAIDCERLTIAMMERGELVRVTICTATAAAVA